MKPTDTSTPQNPKRRSRPFAWSIVLIAATMVAGIAIRFVPLGLPAPITKYGGSMLWALMFYWIVSTLLPSSRLLVAGLITAALTAAVEFFKLYHSPTMGAFRLTLPGVLLLGRVFSVWDIVAFWAAILVGAILDWRIRGNRR